LAHLFGFRDRSGATAREDEQWRNTCLEQPDPAVEPPS
jgi:hypothetical protein